MSQVSLINGHIDEPKRTNYNRIRNMSVEELAKFIDEYGLFSADICYSHCEKTTGNKYKCPYDEKNRDEHCIDCVIEWLNSEVSE